MNIPTSLGELVDKITILEIKKEKINNAEKLIHIEKELLSLNNTFKKSISDPSKIKSLIEKLKTINLKLWNIEDGKRLAEKNNDFSDAVVVIKFKNNVVAELIYSRRNKQRICMEDTR